MQFHIQTDSEIPVSKQLYDQMLFAIASRQFSPGHRLPSTRQLAMQTGLHRNTIGKVYSQLEGTGLVESVPGSGIYVKSLGHESNHLLADSQIDPNLSAIDLVSQSLNTLLAQGYSLTQSRELFLTEIDWRWRCSARVFVTVPRADSGAGELMLQELQQSLGIPVQLVTLDKLASQLAQSLAATVVTSRYHIGVVEATLASSDVVTRSIRVIPVDIQDYEQELALVKTLPKNSYVGIVSLSAGILAVAEMMVHSMRGDDLLVMACQTKDTYKLNATIRRAHTIVSDKASLNIVHQAIEAAGDDLMRIPQVVESETYIGLKSINLLKRELGLI
ncbi:GntR family transcriptional regulator [Chamaesiphon sp.]|uniref:GntR family transcriptional regulator n=1 Tax=Chamaesiphon sp. TaxID=2814140 RepID=UPI00359351CC